MQGKKRNEEKRTDQKQKTQKASGSKSTKRKERREKISFVACIMSCCPMAEKTKMRYSMHLYSLERFRCSFYAPKSQFGAVLNLRFPLWFFMCFNVGINSLFVY